MAMGEDTYVASGWGGYYNGDGTSFSCPVMAGAVACLRQALPYASVQDICDALRASGNNASEPNSYDGYGIPDMVAALHMFDGVNDVTMGENELLSVFPNPSRGKVTVKTINDIEPQEIAVYGITGSLICKALNANELEGVLNTLNSGVYTINVISEQGNQTIKLVVTR